MPGDDSGTDENCDLLPVFPPSPPTSGFAMAKKMKVGVVSEQQGVPAAMATEGGSREAEEAEEKLHHFCMGLPFLSSLPSSETLAKLRQRKKVGGWCAGGLIWETWCTNSPN